MSCATRYAEDGAVGAAKTAAWTEQISAAVLLKMQPRRQMVCGGRRIMPRREIRQYPLRQACRDGAFRDDPNTTHRCRHIRMYINGIYRIAGSVVIQSMGHHTRCSASCTIGHLDRSASGGQDSTSQTERARSESGAIRGGAPAPGTGLCERQRAVIPGAVPRLCRAPERSGGVAPPYALFPLLPL